MTASQGTWVWAEARDGIRYELDNLLKDFWWFVDVADVGSLEGAQPREVAIFSRGLQYQDAV
jgi:hypothetical protein